MKTVNFFGHEITRLIVGDNPFNGYSYIEDIITGAEMKSYYTSKQFYEALFAIEAVGYNCMLPLADPFVIRMLKEYKNDGGKMYFIFQPYMPMDQKVSMQQMSEVEPIGIYHQGGSTDFLYENGRSAEIRTLMKEYRAMGIPVGIGTHRPDVIALAEEENWGADFYVACLQNARKVREDEVNGYLTGKTKSYLKFYPEDRPVMLEQIRQVQKPCIAYKIFAGGQMFVGRTPEQIRENIRSAYREVFSAIKPNDAAAIGVFQKYGDQINEDAALFDEVMREMEGM